MDRSTTLTEIAGPILERFEVLALTGAAIVLAIALWSEFTGKGTAHLTWPRSRRLLAALGVVCLGAGVAWVAHLVSPGALLVAAPLTFLAFMQGTHWAFSPGERITPLWRVGNSHARWSLFFGTGVVAGAAAAAWIIAQLTLWLASDGARHPTGTATAADAVVALTGMLGLAMTGLVAVGGGLIALYGAVQVFRAAEHAEFDAVGHD